MTIVHPMKITRKESIRRLEALYERMTRVSPRRYSQNSFCGTRHCAGGWGATMPEFKKLGLHVWGGDVRLSTKRGDYDAFDALSIFFGLPYKAVGSLFGDSYSVFGSYAEKTGAEQKAAWLSKCEVVIEQLKHAEARAKNRKAAEARAKNRKAAA